MKRAEFISVVFVPLILKGQALAVLEQALALYQATGDVEGQGRVLARLGRIHVFAGTTAAGVARLQPLVAPLCAAGLSLGGQATLLTTLARLYYNSALESGSLAQYGEALSAAEQAEALAEQAQDEHLLGQARVRRGVALVYLERGEEGAQVLEDAIRLLEASGDLEALYVAVQHVSDYYHEWGKYDLALTGYERALIIAERLGDREGIARQKTLCGDLCFALGQWEQARQNLEQAASLLPEGRPTWTLVMSYLLLGRLSLAQGRAEAAAEQLQRSLVLAEQSEQPYLMLCASCAVAYQDLEEGRPEPALAAWNPSSTTSHF